VTYSLSCGDVMPGCAARFDADTEDGIFAQMAPHAEADHGIVEITPEVVDLVRSKITSA
jgi:predicted small metal-binding protein